MPFVIEPARPEDAEDIARVRRAAWIDTYPNPDLGITEKALSVFLDHPRWGDPETRRKRIAEAGPDILTLVARAEESLAGFCIATRKDRQHLLALYVLPVYQGQGLGRALLEHVLTWMDLALPVTLGVVPYNHRAIRFYEKFGFRKARDLVPLDLNGSVMLPEMEMVRDPHA